MGIHAEGGKQSDELWIREKSLYFEDSPRGVGSRDMAAQVNKFAPCSPCTCIDFLRVRCRILIDDSDEDGAEFIFDDAIQLRAVAEPRGHAGQFRGCRYTKLMTHPAVNGTLIRLIQSRVTAD